MSMTVLDALAATPPEPPRPDPSKPSSGAFQRRLAEQHAALRREADRESAREANRESHREANRGISRGPAGARTRRESTSTRRSGGEREARAGAAPEGQDADAETSLAAGGFGGAWGGNGNGNGNGNGKGSGQDGQDGQDGQYGLAGGAAPPAPLAADAELDCETLLDLLPGDGEGGIFELLLPGGERLGVVADLTPRQGTFLLTPSSERLRQQLNQRKMELEKGLAQRMDRHVRLTVL